MGRKSWDRLRFKCTVVFGASVACSFQALKPPAVASALLPYRSLTVEPGPSCKQTNASHGNNIKWPQINRQRPGLPGTTLCWGLAANE